MAEFADEIDVSRARAALDRAQRDDSPAGEDARERAMARLRAAGESV
jgi:F-type H+-transporting ATPase subunit epsilon